MDGLIDLVLCTTCEGESFIRSVDLKTEEARKLINGQKTGLLESLGIEGTRPSCEAELEVLLHHRMQQALYFRALQSIEEKRYESGYKPRKVLPPAILIGVTGRFVIYPKEVLDELAIDTLIITGTLTNVCCESTARDAMLLNYKTIFIGDATGTRSDDEHNPTLINMMQFFADLIMTEDTIDLLSNSS